MRTNEEGFALEFQNLQSRSDILTLYAILEYLHTDNDQHND